MASNRKSIEKSRMEAAFNEAEKIKGKKDAKEFESSVNKIPAFIHTNGIGNTFAFLVSNKNKSQWKNVIKAIYAWLNNENSGFKVKIDTETVNNEADKLIGFVRELNDSEYKALTIELLAYLNWLRKFAKANKINEDQKAKTKSNG